MTKCIKCGSEFVRNSEGLVVDRHDCRYVRAVDALVEGAYAAAKREAETTAGPHTLTPVAYQNNVTRRFHDEMARRTREAGLRG